MTLDDVRAAPVDRTDALTAALREARDYIAEDRECMIDCHTIGGDLTTLDDFDKQFVDEADRVLALIDAALEGQPT